MLSSCSGIVVGRAAGCYLSRDLCMLAAGILI